jgi:hypothetical protein
MHRIETAAHVALLDVLTGEGVLALPDPADDLTMPGSTTSLHASDWDRMMAALAGLGWEISEDDDGTPLSASVLDDGREVVGLFGLDPIDSEPDVEACAESVARMLAAL